MALSDDRANVRFYLPLLPIDGLPEPLRIRLDFNACMVAELLEQLTALYAEMETPQSTNAGSLFFRCLQPQRPEATAMMERLKRLSIVTAVMLAVAIGLVLAICVGSLSLPWNGLLGALGGLFAFGLLIRLWAI